MSYDDTSGKSTLFSRLARKVSKSEGLEYLITLNMFDRDSRRLDARSRATYRAQGLDVPDASEDELNVIADDIHQHYGVTWKELAALAVVGLGLIVWLARMPVAPARQTETEVPQFTDKDTTTQVIPGFGRPTGGTHGIDGPQAQQGGESPHLTQTED